MIVDTSYLCNWCPESGSTNNDTGFQEHTVYGLANAVNDTVRYILGVCMSLEKFANVYACISSVDFCDDS